MGKQSTNINILLSFDVTDGGEHWSIKAKLTGEAGLNRVDQCECIASPHRLPPVYDSPIHPYTTHPLSALDPFTLDERAGEILLYYRLSWGENDLIPPPPPPS